MAGGDGRRFLRDRGVRIGAPPIVTHHGMPVRYNRAMRMAFLFVLLFAVAAFAVACEKSDQVVLQEQLQDANRGCPDGCAEPKQGCTIKGNVSEQGRKFYILPGDKRYDLAIIEPARGEAWFCTAQEALNNDFQPVPPGV